MEKKFKTAHELAEYFCKIMDTRTWGLDIADQMRTKYREQWHHWIAEVNYYPRYNTILSYEEELKNITACIEDILNNSNIMFPCIYTCNIAWQSAGSTEFNVNYEYDGQITIDDVFYNTIKN